LVDAASDDTRRALTRLETEEKLLAGRQCRAVAAEHQRLGVALVDRLGCLVGPRLIEQVMAPSTPCTGQGRRRPYNVE
jgi:hypothetical protein